MNTATFTATLIIINLLWTVLALWINYSWGKFCDEEARGWKKICDDWEALCHVQRRHLDKLRGINGKI